MISAGAEVERRERAIALLLFVAAAGGFAWFLARGSGRWSDVLVDFGRELYVPWRIVEGDVLYRDLAYLNGPLAPYWNAGWFRLFGVRLATLTAVNAGLVAAVAIFVAVVLRRVGGWTSAGAGVALFALLFAVGRFTGLANYDFLGPYSHDLTLGVAFAFAALACALGGEGEPSSARLVASGALLGCVFLTKPEVFAASAASLVAYLALAPRTSGARRARRFALFGGAFVAPPLVAFVALRTAMPAGAALRGVLGGWPAVLDGELARLAFYRRVGGLDEPARNALRALAAFALTVLLLAPAAGLDLVLRSRRARAAAAAGVFVGLAFLSRALDESAWLAAGRMLPIVAVIALAASLTALARSREAGARRTWAGRAALALFALALLAKILLAAQFAHYGFALALPAALCFVALGCDWIPELLRRRGGSGLVFRAAMLALVLSAIAAHGRIATASFDRMTVEVGSGADAFYATPVRGRAVNEALRVVDAKLAPDATLLVLPEGARIAYLARRREPTRYYQFLPPELLLDGEAAIVDALAKHPPDAVLLVHKDTSEYGLPLFGVDYGRAILSWVRGAYPRSRLVAGDPPLRPGTSFGIELLLPER